jgi:DNA-binding MarR family transcriptional regulator
MVKQNLFDSSIDDLAQRIATGLSKISQAMKAKAWQEGFSEGITPTQGQILTFLRQRKKSNPTSLTDIAGHMAVSSATVSEALRVLEEKKFVVKESSFEDRRFLTVRLTDSGRQLADKVFSWPDFLSSSVEDLTSHEQEVFLKVLIKMIKGIQDREEIPLVGMCVTCRFFRPYVHKDKNKPHHCEYVNGAFGARHFRVECPDHELAQVQERKNLWDAFIHERPVRR